MTKIAVFTGGRLSGFSTDFELFVGVDRGSLFLLKNQLPLDLAVGDFDSVSKEELQMIQEKAGDFIKAAPEKRRHGYRVSPKGDFLKIPTSTSDDFRRFWRSY